MVNASKVGHLGSTTRFGDIVNPFPTFVIIFICVESLTQSRVQTRYNEPT